jgi:hypothetical protein
MPREAATVGSRPAVFLLESRVGAVEETDLARMHQVLLHALARLVADGVAIRYTHGLFVPDDRRCLYLLEAADPASVARAADIAGLPLAQVRSALDLAALPQPGTRPRAPDS